MSKVLQEKIDELFEATKDLKTLEEIKPHCARFNEWVSQQSYSEKSLGTLFSRYGLYSKFRKLDLKQGENAELIPKYEIGRAVQQECRHRDLHSFPTRRSSDLSEKSLGTLFSRYGLYSKFRKLDLKQGENAELIPKY